MTGKTGPPGAGDPAGDRRGTRPDAAGLADGLDRLRDHLLRRLAEIESLAVEQLDLAGTEPDDRERALRERVAHLEASQSRLVAEAKRKEQEWLGVVKQIEEDRRLLTEAWERLEREQTEAHAAESAQPAGGGGYAGVHPGYAPQAAVPAAALRSPPPEGNDSVTRAVLWQFQALKRDVRRNAKGR